MTRAASNRSMRHQNKVKKLGRPAAQRRSLLANLVCSLIEHKQIRTTVAKAKAVRPFAERMVTLAKRGDLHARRQAVGFLYSKSVVKELFEVVGPAAATREGGYTRITKLGPRLSDSGPDGVHRMGRSANARHNSRRARRESEEAGHEKGIEAGRREAFREEARGEETRKGRPSREGRGGVGRREDSPSRLSAPHQSRSHQSGRRIRRLLSGQIRTHCAA